MVGDTRSNGDDIAAADLDAVMQQVPKGAMALSAISVLLLLVGWSYVYFFVFIPRGTVG